MSIHVNCFRTKLEITCVRMKMALCERKNTNLQVQESNRLKEYSKNNHSDVQKYFKLQHSNQNRT